MTDKEKIRKEVQRRFEQIKNNIKESDSGAFYQLKELLEFINSLQEEPVSKVWHDASEPPIIDKTFLLVAPNGNSSLCLWGGKELHSVTIGGGHSVLCKGDIYLYIDDLLKVDTILMCCHNCPNF